MESILSVSSHISTAMEGMILKIAGLLPTAKRRQQGW